MSDNLIILMKIEIIDQKIKIKKNFSDTQTVYGYDASFEDTNSYNSD